jgi:glycosyltransferase involved in cell wall biosynthesis
MVYAEYTKERIRHHIPQFTGPIHVSPLGVDHSQFHAEAKEEDQAAVASLGIDRPFVLQVGALAPRKKPEVTLEAFGRLKARGEFQLVLPGKGKDEAVAELRELATRLGIGEDLVLPGFVPDELLPRLYRRCRAFVFASEYEGFGLPIVEAMACGAPVIVALTSCIAEVAGNAAITVSTGNAEELAEALERVLGNGGEAARLSERGIAHSRAFTWRRTAERTVDLYHELLGEA